MAIKNGYKKATYYIVDDDNSSIKESRWTHAGTIEIGDTTLDQKIEDMETYLITDDDRDILDALSLDSDGYIICKGEKLGAPIPNVIETVKVDGTALSVDNKSVNIIMPKKLSQFSNDTNYISDLNYKHTDNNFTNAYKNKLESINVNPDGSTTIVNIENVSVNGAIQEINNKVVDISVPTKVSQLTNDSNYISDLNYHHTDNNYTDSDKNKLTTIETSAQVNTIETISVDGTNINPVGKNVNIVIPKTLGSFTNDMSYVSDSSYVHTDNNFTSALRTKLYNIDTGAQVNAIETITVNNGTAQQIVNKNVNLTIPTKASELVNDDNTVKDANYSTLKTKVNGIEANAQVNKLEGVKVNGTAKTISNKTVDITYNDVVTDSNFDSSDITWTTNYVVNNDTIDAGGTSISVSLSDSDFETANLTWTTNYVVDDSTIDAGGTSITLADSAFETTDLTFNASDFA